MKKFIFQFLLSLLFTVNAVNAQWNTVLQEDFVFGAGCTAFDQSCTGNWCNSHGLPDIAFSGSCDGGNSAEMRAFKNDNTGLERSQGIVYDFGSILEYGHYRVSFCYCIKEYASTTADLGLTAKLLQLGPGCAANASPIEEIPNIIFSEFTDLYDDVIDPNIANCVATPATWYDVDKAEFEITSDHRYLWIYPNFDPNNSDGVDADICISNILIERNDTKCQAKIEVEDCLSKHCVYGLSGLSSSPSYNESIVSYDWTITSAGMNFPNPPSEPNILFSPELNGNYTICLTITDTDQCTSTECVEITVDCFEESTCQRPQNPQCFYSLPNQFNFYWNPVPGAIGYEFKQITNTSSCGCPTGISAQIITNVQNNIYPLPAQQSGWCFTWRVRANCGNGIFSPWSTEKCYSNGQCHDPLKINDDDSSKRKINSSISPKVFPNPTSGELNFEMKAPGELLLSVEVYNVDGKLIKLIPSARYPDGFYKTNLSLDNSFSSGLHHVLFKTNYGEFSEKIMILNED